LKKVGHFHVPIRDVTPLPGIFFYSVGFGMEPILTTAKIASFITYPGSVGKNIPHVFWNWWNWLRYLPAMPISTDLLQTFMHHFISQWKILSRVATNFYRSSVTASGSFAKNLGFFFWTVLKKTI
jgi:hypothetical protein